MIITMSAMMNATKLVKLVHSVVAVLYTTAPARAMLHVPSLLIKASLVFFFIVGTQNDGGKLFSFPVDHVT